jgi:hypothetical protein
MGVVPRRCGAGAFDAWRYEPMPSADDYVKAAIADLGLGEDPANSNRIRYWTDIGMPELQGNPWCAASSRLAVGVSWFRTARVLRGTTHPPPGRQAWRQLSRDRLVPRQPLSAWPRCTRLCGRAPSRAARGEDRRRLRSEDRPSLAERAVSRRDRGRRDLWTGHLEPSPPTTAKGR